MQDSSLELLLILSTSALRLLFRVCTAIISILMSSEPTLMGS